MNGELWTVDEVKLLKQLVENQRNKHPNIQNKEIAKRAVESNILPHRNAKSVEVKICTLMPRYLKTKYKKNRKKPQIKKYDKLEKLLKKRSQTIEAIEKEKEKLILIEKQIEQMFDRTPYKL